jgi:hypothetical protein
MIFEDSSARFCAITFTIFLLLNRHRFKISLRYSKTNCKLIPCFCLWSLWWPLRWPLKVTWLHMCYVTSSPRAIAWFIDLCIIHTATARSFSHKLAYPAFAPWYEAALFSPGTKLHTKVWNIVPRYEISYQGMKFLTKVWNFLPRYEISC